MAFPTSGLVSYYKLENTTDLIGSNTLTNTGSVTFTAGKIDNGANLGTSNSSKKLSTGNDLGITGDYSISFWAKILTVPGSGTIYYLAVFGDAGRHIEHAVAYGNSAGTKRIYTHVWEGGVTDTDTSFYNVDLGTADFYHFVWTYKDSTKAGILYLNGTNRASGTFANGTTGGADNFELGYSFRFLGGWASAHIDEVGVWNRELTSTEASDLYNSGSGIQPTQNLSLVAEAGSFTLTGIDAVVGRAMTLVADVGSFILTGFDALFSRTGWINTPKNTSTWTNTSKNSSSWSNTSKNTSTWTNTDKS